MSWGTSVMLIDYLLNVAGHSHEPLLIIARRNWRHCLCESSGGKQCVLSSLGVMGRSATSTAHRVNSMRDGTRTGRYEDVVTGVNPL